MAITLYGSNLCPKTLRSLQKLADNGITPVFVNVTGSINLLMDWVQLRDTNEIFKELIGTRKIGFPTFKLEDGTLTRDIDMVIETAKQR